MTGVLIMAGAVLQMMFFLWAAARRSYMAVALPVMAALAAISALAFWIGWTMFSTESELEEELEGEEAIP
jgi:CHASE2 domain-containing sensor protein